MTLRTSLAVVSLVAPVLAWPQQANVNLDFNPQKNTEQLIPFSAPLNSPEMHDDRTVTFRLRAPAAREVRLVGVAILTALGRTNQPVPVTVEHGHIQGTSKDGVTLYRGIPCVAFGGDPNRVTIC